MEPPVASPSPSRAAPTPPAPRRAARTTCPGAAPLATSTLTAGSASARARVSAGARRGWIFIPALQREAVWPARHSPLLWAQFPQLYNEERRGGAQGAINSGGMCGPPQDSTPSTATQTASPACSRSPSRAAPTLPAPRTAARMATAGAPPLPATIRTSSMASARPEVSSPRHLRIQHRSPKRVSFTHRFASPPQDRHGSAPPHHSPSL